MDVKMYELLMGSSAFVIGMLGVMLGATTISPKGGSNKLRKARNILVPSYFVLVLFILVHCLTGYDRRIGVIGTLFAASFQVLLFTMSMLVFIHPGEIRWKMVFRHVGVIIVVGLALFSLLFCSNNYYSWSFYVGIIVYIGQMAFYIREFFLAYRKVIQEDCYDDGEKNCLWRVKVGFYTALVIGILTLPVLFYPSLDIYFIPLYVLFYSFMVMWFVNFPHRMDFEIPISTQSLQGKQMMAYLPETGGRITEVKEDDIKVKDPNESADENVSTNMERMLYERLRQYIDQKEYCRKDIPSEVVVSLGTTRAFLRRYMSNHYGMWFSTWRNELRIHEACLLYQKSPGISVMDMTQKIGYSNSGNFCRDFKKTAGVTPKEYCMRIRLSGVEPQMDIFRNKEMETLRK